MPDDQPDETRGVAVFSPAPRLTITIERGAGGADEPHLHAGGQGPWAARMARILGADVQLCLPLGGESGAVLRHLLESWEVGVKAVEVRGDTALYVHDRRGGEREEIASTPEPPLDRHELDDLYGIMLGAAMESGVALLTGTQDPDVVDAAHYGRLVTDLRSNGVEVVVDLSGPQLLAAAEAGAGLVKVSHTELHECGCAPGVSRSDADVGIDALRERGARDVIVTRAAEPSVAVIGGDRYEVRAPPLETVEHRGAGDSLTGAVAAALARGDDVLDAVRLGTAAGALNVTRHGLATGVRTTIEELSNRVELRAL